MSTAVVVPTRGHSDLLVGCLQALAAQDPPVDEVVVVDDSDDGSLGPLPGVTVLRSGGVGPYAARNLGWRHTSADVLLFCDSRSRPRPGWSGGLAALFTDPAVVLAGSDVLVVGGGSAAARAAAAQQVFRLARYLERPFFRPYLPTCNLAVRRSALAEVGGFPEVRSGGDAEVCWRVLDATGGRVAAVPEVLLDWVPRESLLDYLEQNYRYGRSNRALRGRWEQAGADVPAPMPWVRLALRAARVSLVLGAAVAARRQERVAAVLPRLADVLTSLGYAVAHAQQPVTPPGPAAGGSPGR